MNDPRLWQVRVKRGCEKQATFQLMNKSIEFAKRGQHLSILSVTCTDKVEGFVFVEAFKDIHVKEAVKGLSSVLGGKVVQVSREEMPGIYQNEKQTVNLERHQWVRVKQGLYGGDLGLVEKIEDNRVWLRLVPRMELQKEQQAKGGKPNRFLSIRPPQRIFNETLVAKSVIEQRSMTMPDIKKHFIVYKKQWFRQGFLFKSFPFKQIQMDNVRPTIEEVQNFATYLNKNGDQDEDPNEITGDELIKRTFLSANNSDIAKGDKIEVVKGDMISLQGSVVAIENGFVLLKPLIEGLDQNLKVPVDFVVKYFQPGDHIRIVDGKFKGETGIVIECKDKYAHIALTQNNREIKVFTNNLKLKSEIDQSLMAGFIDKKKAMQYRANDLVMYNSKNVGVVLQVQEDFLKVINDEGEIHNVKIVDINKKIDLGAKASAVDSHRNTLYPDNVIKITAGKNKGRKGVIKYIYKNTLFLWDKDLHQSNGLFVEHSRNVVILGDEHIRAAQGDGAVAAMNRRLRDPLQGKDVEIIKGEWKGYKGRVRQADDRQVTLELSSKCNKITLPKEFIKLLADKRDATRGGDEYGYGGATVYEAGKTPMQFNTPSYYPQSPGWGTQGFGTDCNFF